jgi:hypothetical protein
MLRWIRCRNVDCTHTNQTLVRRDYIYLWFCLWLIITKERHNIAYRLGSKDGNIITCITLSLHIAYAQKFNTNVLTSCATEYPAPNKQRTVSWLIIPWLRWVRVGNMSRMDEKKMVTQFIHTNGNHFSFSFGFGSRFKVWLGWFVICEASLSRGHDVSHCSYIWDPISLVSANIWAYLLIEARRQLESQIETDCWHVNST